jgi:hypothetical protein
MTKNFICPSIAVAVLFSLATTSAVNAQENTLNEAVAKIEAVGKMIADLKLASVQADAAANQAGAVLAAAVKTAVAPTPSAVTPRCSCQVTSSCCCPIPYRVIRPVVYYPHYYPAYHGHYYRGCGWRGYGWYW